MSSQEENANVKVFNNYTGEDLKWNRDKIADFLYDALDEYGDEREYILRAIDYVFRKQEGKGGFIVISTEGDEITGAVVVNETGMSGYIPENILVYIAVSSNHRGKGLGKILMKKSLELANGDVALHVEPDNPAKFLYEKVGFTNKYLEMRHKKK